MAPAEIQWRDGCPYAPTYDDTYYSEHYDQLGIDEVRRVFLQPAHLEERAHQDVITVAELGFGTGLNFLVTADWVAQETSARLNFISFESHPLATADWTRCADLRGDALDLARALSKAAPPLLTGWHHRVFADGRIRLSIYHGGADEGLDLLAQSLNANDPRIDAWYLDGFAPDRNPEMWTEPLLQRIGQLTRSGGHIATFTAAGRVRRAMLSAGFDVTKVDQRPNKRESLLGKKTADKNPTQNQNTERPTRAVHNVAIHGAGIAGASLARHFADAGEAVTVYDPEGPASGASSIRQAILHPRLLGDGTPVGAYRLAAFHYATNYLSRFKGYSQTGVLHVESDDQHQPKFDRVVDFYDADAETQDWLIPLSAEEATDKFSTQLQNQTLFFPQGAVIDLPIICAELLDHPNIEVRSEAGSVDSTVTTYICTAVAANTLPGFEWLEMNRVAGRLHEVHHAETVLSIPIVGNGYAVPSSGSTMVGSTYEYSPWDDQDALDHNLRENSPYLPSQFEVGQHQRGVRALTSDRNPIVGRLGKNLWMSAGHGSIGTSSAPYAAAILTHQLLGLAPVASDDELMMLDPHRFKERQQRRGLLTPKKG
ncbi:MAG: tRNA (5-methylaminomethyl-2-thiouridine)(34)-methyltransferase MnmD [Pseudomonadales bacterium]|nr:tRNA (5-methylaminomethyl-2-thiouridine)(34)-methyltransferase MnmD [Pseudomonadales bacterium]